MNWLTGNPEADAKRLIPHLLDATKRDRATQELIRLGAASVPGLIEALQSRDPNLPPLSKQVLTQIGAAATPALTRILRDGQPALRKHAAEMMGHIKDPAALPALIEALNSEYFAVREIATYALGQFVEPKTIPYLLNMLKDAEPEVRAAACWSIGKFHDPNHYAKLSDILFDDPELIARQAAVRALTSSKDPAILPHLMDALRDSFWWYGREQAADILLQAIQSFGAQAVDPLLEALGDKEGAVRRFAATILGNLHDPRALDDLGMMLYDLHHEVGEAAAMALVNYGGASLEVLKEASVHPEAGIREHVVKALSQIRDARVTPILIGMLHDPDRTVQKQVILALGNMKDALARPALQEIASSRTDRELALLAKQALGQY